MKQTFSYPLAAFAALCMWSCKSPVIKGSSADVDTIQNTQIEEIERLKAEVAELEGRMKQMPLDRTLEIKTLQAEATEQLEELQKYEAAISKLQARKLEIEKEFEDYKREYVIR